MEAFRVTYLDNDSSQHTLKAEEKWQLLDSMPLFAPTKWNASQRLMREHFGKVAQNYAYYEPKIQLRQFLEKTNWNLHSQAGVIKDGSDLLLQNSRLLDHFSKLHKSAYAIRSMPFPCLIEVAIPDGGRVIKELPYFNTVAQNSKTYLEPVYCVINYERGMQKVTGLYVLKASGDIEFDTFSETWIRENFIAQFAEESGLYTIYVYPPEI